MTEKAKLQPWQSPNGAPKPEWNLTLRFPLSDGTKVLELREPTVKALRRATKLLDADAGGPTNTSSVLAFGVALVSEVANLPEAIIDEITSSQFQQAVEYLQSFQ